ncbi:MAG: Uma2 family endonuclease [Elainella sp.]
MTTQSATLVRWTIRDYHTMIDAGLFLNRRVELLNGLIVEMAPEGPDHADLSNDALEFFMAAANGRYRVRPAKPITIPSNNSEPEPDIALVRSQPYRQSHPTPDDVFLIIEFSNTSLAKDTDDKRRAYASAGIQDYWVVNLRDRQLIIYRNPADSDYTSEQRLRSGSISPLAFPDITLTVQMLLN